MMAPYEANAVLLVLAITIKNVYHLYIGHLRRASLLKVRAWSLRAIRIKARKRKTRILIPE